MDAFKSLEEQNKMGVSNPVFWEMLEKYLEGYFNVHPEMKPINFHFESFKSSIYTVAFHPEDCSLKELLALHHVVNLRFIEKMRTWAKGIEDYTILIKGTMLIYNVVGTEITKNVLKDLLSHGREYFLTKIQEKKLWKILMEPKETAGGTIVALKYNYGPYAQFVNISSKQLVKGDFNTLEKRSLFNNISLYKTNQILHLTENELKEAMDRLAEKKPLATIQEITDYIGEEFEFDRQQSLLSNYEDLVKMYLRREIMSMFPKEIVERCDDTTAIVINMNAEGNSKHLAILLVTIFDVHNVYQKLTSRNIIKDDTLTPIGGKYIDIPTQLQQSSYEGKSYIQFIGQKADGTYEIVSSDLAVEIKLLPLEGITDEVMLQQEYPDFVYTTPLK